MKKQRSKSGKICRKKGQDEPNVDKEHEKKINALATQFREDQLKTVLRRCFSNVAKYGPEAIMKAVEDSWTATAACHGVTDDKVKSEEELARDFVDKALEVDAQPWYRTTHPHEETSKHNALFLIESSESLEDYDLDALSEMRQAYKEARYDDVADLAYLQDCRRRPGPQPPERRISDDTTLCREKPTSAWQRVAELLDEVAEEDKNRESPLKCCVEAVRLLSRDLTYDNRVAAKDSIRKAIKHLEE